MDVTVVVPARNAGAFLLAAVRSALDQRPDPHEVLVVDDGSTDDSIASVETLSGVRVLRGPGQGPAGARNVGIEAATGSLLAFLDADDLWLPGKLERQVARFEDPELGLAFTDFFRGDDPALPGPARLADYQLVCEGDVLHPLLRENFILTSSVMVRRELLARCGGFDGRFRGTEDIELWIRLSRETRFGWVREPLAFKRDHPDNLTRDYAFPFAQVTRWLALRDELAPHVPEETAYIEEQLALARYGAGRHALRHGDLVVARRELRAASEHGRTRSASRPWRWLASLPDPLVRALLAMKQGGSGVREPR